MHPSLSRARKVEFVEAATTARLWRAPCARQWRRAGRLGKEARRPVAAILAEREYAPAHGRVRGRGRRSLFRWRSISMFHSSPDWSSLTTHLKPLVAPTPRANKTQIIFRNSERGCTVMANSPCRLFAARGPPPRRAISAAKATAPFHPAVDQTRPRPPTIRLGVRRFNPPPPPTPAALGYTPPSSHLLDRRGCRFLLWCPPAWQGLPTSGNRPRGVSTRPTTWTFPRPTTARGPLCAANAVDRRRSRTATSAPPPTDLTLRIYTPHLLCVRAPSPPVALHGRLPLPSPAASARDASRRPP